jgi:hypothetical protein
LGKLARRSWRRAVGGGEFVLFVFESSECGPQGVEARGFPSGHVAIGSQGAMTAAVREDRRASSRITAVGRLIGMTLMPVAIGFVALISGAVGQRFFSPP